MTRFLYVIVLFGLSGNMEGLAMFNDLELSEYVKLVVTFPEEHADRMREVIDQAGAGRWEKYSFCSFSTKGVARFFPHEGTHPYIGQVNKLETVIEEKIETVCHRTILKEAIEKIKRAHPYESALIEIYPIYAIGCKFSSKK